MKQMIETFVIIFLTMMAVLLFSQFIGAELTIHGAKDFHADSIAQIEASDFDIGVIEACKKAAEKRGYTMIINNKNEGKMICKSCNTVFNEETNVCPNCGKTLAVAYVKERFCRVNLRYTVDLKLINVHKEGLLSGYAR